MFVILHIAIVPYPYTAHLASCFLLTAALLCWFSQEEDSPGSGEIRRVESSPTPLKRDRSFSEHDLAELRGEILPSLSESGHLGTTVVLRGERPRANTLGGAWPLPTYRGQLESDNILWKLENVLWKHKTNLLIEA